MQILSILQTYEWSIFIGQNNFSNDGSKILLIFQPIFNNFRKSAGLIEKIKEWKSKGLPSEKKWSLPLQQIDLSPKVRWYNSKIRVQSIAP